MCKKCVCLVIFLIYFFLLFFKLFFRFQAPGRQLGADRRRRSAQQVSWTMLQSLVAISCRPICFISKSLAALRNHDRTFSGKLTNISLNVCLCCIVAASLTCWKQCMMQAFCGFYHLGGVGCGCQSERCVHYVVVVSEYFFFSLFSPFFLFLVDFRHFIHCLPELTCKH